jgi:hypothetical protein
MISMIVILVLTNTIRNIQNRPLPPSFSGTERAIRSTPCLNDINKGKKIMTTPKNKTIFDAISSRRTEDDNKKIAKELGFTYEIIKVNAKLYKITPTRLLNSIIADRAYHKRNS